MKIALTPLAAVRLFVAAVGGFLIGWLWPANLEPAAHGPDIVMSIIVSVVFLFLFQQAISRYRDLQAAVYLEINKLRRLYHISKNLLNLDVKFRLWFMDLHEHLLGYLAAVGAKDLQWYSKSNPSYRKLSYHVYKAPDLTKHNEQALYDDLLRTSATIAESRQRIKEMLSQGVSSYVWAVVGLLAIGQAAVVLASASTGFADRLAAGLVVSALLVAVNLLAEMNSNAARHREWAKRYRDNIAKLDYSRDEPAKAK